MFNLGQVDSCMLVIILQHHSYFILCYMVKVHTNGGFLGLGPNSASKVLDGRAPPTPPGTAKIARPQPLGQLRWNTSSVTWRVEGLCPHPL